MVVVPNPDCRICSGTGVYMEWEEAGQIVSVPCPCLDEPTASVVE